MGVTFTPDEGSVLYRLLAENSTDIILKTDCAGNLLHGLPTMSRLGLLPPAQSGARHLRDLVDPVCEETVLGAHREALDGHGEDNWIEFLARSRGQRKRWFAIRTRRIVDAEDCVCGGISIVRSLEERRSFEEKLFAAAMTDPLTGLTNRSAFVSMLQHLVEQNVDGCLAMFDIDHFKAINMRYGHSAGDEVLVAFADLMRALTREADIISRTGGESFGVLLPRTALSECERICREIVVTLSESSGAAGDGGLKITVSGGLAAIAESLDDTIRRAELALAMAKARGRNRLQLDPGAPALH